MGGRKVPRWPRNLNPPGCTTYDLGLNPEDLSKSRLLPEDLFPLINLRSKQRVATPALFVDTRGACNINPIPSRHSGIDLLGFYVNSAPEKHYLRTLEGEGLAQVKPANRFTGEEALVRDDAWNYCHLKQLKGRFSWLVTVYPNRFASKAALDNFLNHLFPKLGAGVNRIALHEIELHMDLGVPFERALPSLQVASKAGHEVFANDGNAHKNGIRFGQQNKSHLIVYDKTRRGPRTVFGTKETHPHQPRTRLESKVKKPELLHISRTYGDLNMLMARDPFTPFSFHKVVIDWSLSPAAAKIGPTRLTDFDCIARREGLSPALRYLNTDRHLTRLKKSNALTFERIDIDLSNQWRLDFGRYLLGLWPDTPINDPEKLMEHALGFGQRIQQVSG